MPQIENRHVVSSWEAVIFHLRQKKSLEIEKKQTVTSGHIPMIVQSLNEKGIRGQLTSIG